MDRLYLNGYVPTLQRPQNQWWYLVKHKGCPVQSPVLLRKWVDTFVADIRGFAARNRLPLVQFERGERKEDVARRRLARFRHAEGVVLIGVAQEKVNGFRTYLSRCPSSKADALDDAPMTQSRGLRLVDGASSTLERSGVQRDAAEPLQVVADPVAVELEAVLALRRSGADPKALRRALRRIEELLDE
jgi:hypothetical protein